MLLPRWMAPTLRGVLPICVYVVMAVKAPAQSMRWTLENDSLPINTPRSATADDVIRSVVAALGGDAAWRSVHSSMLRYTLQVEGKAGKTLLMMDDWSAPRFRYRRAFAGMKVTPQVHDGDSTYEVQKKGSSTPLRIHEFDRVHVLASHLPGAAASILLQDSRYHAQEASQCSQELQCIDVFRAKDELSPYIKEQRWEINSATHLPRTIKLWVPDAIHGERGVWETVTFGTYKQVEGLQVPQTFAVSYAATIMGLTWTLQSVRFNVEFSPEAFNREVNPQ